MSLVGFKAQNHGQQTAKRGPKPEVDDRATPPELFDPLHARFCFSIDVAASPANAKLERFYSTEDDGLAQSWAGHNVWCNPPYSDIRPWVEKAAAAQDALVVMLLPANRTEQAWWQDLIEPGRRDGSIEVEFLRGRQRFIRAGADGIGPNERPPFGVCLVIWGKP